METAATTTPTFKPFQRQSASDIPGFETLSAEERLTIDVVARVLPFRTNNYVCSELIDWSKVPDDPLFQLTFPQRDMIDPRDFNAVADLVRKDADEDVIAAKVREIQLELNPHPSGQVQLNVPTLDGAAVQGMQHKYDRTVLFFASQGQTCHAYCTYCFRWPQFMQLDDLKFATREADGLTRYLRAHPEVTDVLFTGGDPMIMRTKLVRRYIEPLMHPDFEHITIRIGTKAPAYWPFRFTTDNDADDLLALFEEVVDSGRHLAIMAHYTHPNELSTDAAELAVRRIRDTGAVVRSQSPVVRHVNDSGAVWADMITRQVKLGIVPYYMFVERDTGAKRYFEIPLDQALAIYNDCWRKLSGLGRTLRGPVMSATPGKVIVEDVLELQGETVFALRMLQSRNPDWSNRLFFARFDPNAAWWDQLQPAFGENHWFFQDELDDFVDDLVSRVSDVSQLPLVERS